MIDTRAALRYFDLPFFDRPSQEHLAQAWLVYALTFVPVMLLLAVAVVQTATPLSYLTKDPLTVAEMAPAACCRVYYGAISNIGILLWCVAAAVCLFTALILWLADAKSTDAGRFAPALLAAGLFSGWMTLDDLFLVHENVLPALGIPQKLVYVIYALITMAYLAFARRLILGGRLVMFACAIGLLTLSVGVDVVATSEGFMHVLIEDGAKLIGIAAWAAFHIEVAASVLSARLRSQSERMSRIGSAAPA